MCDDSAFAQKQAEIDREIQRLENEKLQIVIKLKALKTAKEELRNEYSLNKFKNRPDASQWEASKYPWTTQAYHTLQTVFNFKHFRSNQLAAINATLSKKHVLLVMPTGGGKSLVYQLPALITKNLTVVVSPLISLIEDQLSSLEKLGIAAATVNSSTKTDKKKDTMSKMLNNQINIIFVTPEWLAKTKVFMNNLTKLHGQRKIERFVIDEVHCCSHWGHDFRKDYLSLSLLKDQFPGVPILGLTATATASVIVDIQNILRIPDAVILTSPYNRANLFYKVKTKPESREECIKYLEDILKRKYKDKSGIIYTTTQKECEELASELRQRDLRVAPYHASLEPEVKSKVYQKWMTNYYQAVIATVAFGMGIDKPDVRFVLHYTIPKSIEGLYQESGRAGRDNKDADCILMYSLNDWLKLVAMTQNKEEEQKAMSVLEYCLNKTVCRRKIISTYFDDDWRATDCVLKCDYCKSQSENPRRLVKYDVRQCLLDLLKIIDQASDAEVNLTLKKLLDTWFQIGAKSSPRISGKPSFSKSQGEFIIAFLITKSYLVVRRGYSLVQTLAYIDRNINNEPAFTEGNIGEPIYMEYDERIKMLPKQDVQNSSTEPAGGSSGNNADCPLDETSLKRSSSGDVEGDSSRNTEYCFLDERLAKTSKKRKLKENSHGKSSGGGSETEKTSKK